MKNLLLALTLLCLLLIPFGVHSAVAPASAPTTNAMGIPDVVSNGFRSYKASGYIAAMTAWVSGSYLEIDTAGREAISTSFAKMENSAGKFVDPEVIRIVSLSPSTTLAYVVVKYQRGLMFMCFTCYKTTDSWLVSNISLNMDPAKVLPTNIMGGL